MTPSTGVYASECILTSESNLERKLAAAHLDRVDLRHPSVADSAIYETGYASVDGRNIPVMSIGNGQRAIPTRWLNALTNQIVLFKTEEEAKIAILDRLLKAQHVNSYVQLVLDDNPVSYAVGVKGPDALVLVAFGGEDLGFLADVEDYATPRPRLILHWINSRITSAASLDYLIECIGRRMFIVDAVTFALSIRDDPPRNKRRILPEITGVTIDLTGFARPSGTNARNS